MSIDLNWDTVTGGADGEELAHKIRDFIHARFQTITLPRFIKSVEVHTFEFGTVPPELELKDITDPLPDFYEGSSDVDDDDDDDEEHKEDEYEGEFGNRNGNRNGNGNGNGNGNESRNRSGEEYGMHPGYVGRDPDSPSGRRNQGPTAADSFSKLRGKERVSHLPPHLANLGSAWRDMPAGYMQDLGSPFLGVSTPGIPGGTSNMHYFHSQFNSLSGTQTPLAAVAGAQHRGTGNNLPPSRPKYPSYPSVHPPSPTPNNRHSLSPDERSMPRSLSRGRHSSVHTRHASQGSISVGEYSVPLGISLTTAQQQQQRSMSPSISSFAVGTPPSHNNQLLGINHGLREKHSVSTLAPTSVGTSRPPTRDAASMLGFGAEGGFMSQVDGSGNEEAGQGGSRPSGAGTAAAQQHQSRSREPRSEDMQAVFRIRYSGDVRLLLTANILLDYPMPSFVGIPVQLSITGMTFDGVGVLAKIRQRLHFCFLSPEDAVAAVGSDEYEDAGGDLEARPAASAGAGAPATPLRPGGAHNAQSPISPRSPTKIGGLLQEIRVESEIGQRESGKQSLKNVGKVERFVLEQVRRIFEDELVYPSFWTFLV